MDMYLLVMTLSLKEEYMCWTQRLSFKRVIQFANESKKILYISLDDSPSPITALGPRCYWNMQFSGDVVRVTISYYGEDREMTNLCCKLLVNPGRLLRVTNLAKPVVSRS